MPNITPGGDAVKAMHLLLHELRGPVSVAQGYLRLLRDGRLSKDEERQRAIDQTVNALKRIGELCTEAGELANEDSPATAHRYPVAEFVMALAAEAEARAITMNVQEGPFAGQVQALPPARAAAAIATVLMGALRHASTAPAEAAVGGTTDELIVTSGDAATRARLLALPDRPPFDPWRGGTGLVVPLAVKQLLETGAHVWSTGDPSSVAIAVSLEPNP